MAQEMTVQFTLTVAEGKRLIARAVARQPKVVRALKSHRILLKGGTTVAAVAAELGAPVSLGVCGRISPTGTRGPRHGGSPYFLLYDEGCWRGVDDCFVQVVRSFRPWDVVITGANVLDAGGRAAFMAGSLFGGEPGALWSGVAPEGIDVIVAVGLEKLIPGSVEADIGSCGRRRIDLAMGIAVGLLRITGEVVTEIEACRILFGVEATVIGKGGIRGAQGSTTRVAHGPAQRVLELFETVRSIKGATEAGDPTSLEECEPGSPGCQEELACVYRAGWPHRRGPGGQGGHRRGGRCRREGKGRG